MDFKPFFDEYENLVRQVDAAFDAVKADYGGCVRCRVGCADCCYALFDVTLVEAIYIKEQFDRRFEGPERAALVERANEADRQVHRLKKQAFKAHEAGKPEQAVLEEMANQRVRCPCLNADDQCQIYDVRPVTCRVYGVPTVIGGRGHTCGESGFEEGQSYPTIKLDALYQKLYRISQSLANSLNTRYAKLGELLVPLSMALLTDYDETYLGVRSAPTSTEKE